MFSKKSEKGQALILIALAVIAFVGLTGLAVDGGRVLLDRRKAQNGADAAALAAAMAKVKGTAISSAVSTAAAQNGYNNDGTTNTITITTTNPFVGCDGVSRTYTPASDYIMVTIRAKTSSTFAGVVGIQSMGNCVDATVRAQAGTSTTPPHGGAAIVSTATSGNQTVLLNGNATVTTTGTGVGMWVNSSGTQALFLNGSTSLNMTGPAQVVGNYGKNGNPSLGAGGVVTGVPARVLTPDPAWASIPAIPAKPTCSSNGSFTKVGTAGTVTGTYSNLTVQGGTAQLNPGNWGTILLNGSGSAVVLNPGTYCISGNFNANGSGNTISMPSGAVKMVLTNSLILNGGSVLTANDLEIYTTNASMTLNGGATMTASRLRFYSSGSSTFIVNGNATLTSPNCHIYLASGNPVWNGSSIITIAAPPTGDPYAGLLFYMPWSNSSAVILNGGSAVSVTGTMLMPHATVTANGSSNFNALNSQIIGYTFLFNGGGDFAVNYDASQNYGGTPQASSVELIK